MRALILTAAVATAVVASRPGPAAAWDGPGQWYERADAANPGGGGIFGTGGLRDHRITCLDCHVDRVDNGVLLDFRFQPQLGTAGGNATFVPGQRYKVDVTLVGETLRPPCGQFLTHVNNFAADFEDDDGAVVGSLESDSGQSAAACPAQYPRPATGTTALYRDCQVIFSKDLTGATAWSFYWTAPATGSTVRLYYGAVDGNCSMTSMGDGAVSGRKTLVAAQAASATPRPAAPSPLAAALLALAALAAGLLLWAGRRPAA